MLSLYIYIYHYLYYKRVIELSPRSIKPQHFTYSLLCFFLEEKRGNISNANLHQDAFLSVREYDDMGVIRALYRRSTGAI